MWHFSFSTKSNIIPEDNDNSDNEVENNSSSSADNNSTSKINDVLCHFENNVRNDFGSTKNEKSSLQVPNSNLKPSISITDVVTIIAPFDGNQYQNVVKWHCDLEDVISLFDLSGLN